MKTRSIMNVTLAVGMLFGASVLATAQTKVVNKLRVVNRTTKAVVTIEAASTLSASQTFTFPVSAGTAGQLMTTSSSGSGNNPMQWTTAGTSASALSERKTANVDYAPAVTDSALIVAVEANKSYRIEGLLHLGRLSDNTPQSDNLKITVEAPTGTTRLLYGVRCYDCPAGTTGVPLRASGTTAVTSGTIDPAGVTDDYTTRVYSIEGIVDTGSTAGFVTLTIIDPATSSNSLRIGAQSAIVLTEVD
jgi:hypothetical protein